MHIHNDLSCIPKGVIIVHKGALGDFLHIWPSLVALRRHFGQIPLYWAGRPAYRLWTDPLDLIPCPGLLRQATDRLYSAPTWPPELDGFLVIWFGLHTPPTHLPFPDLWFLPGIEPGTYAPPRRMYARALARLGIPESPDWLCTWKTLFCTPSGPGCAHRILLFPGAGHKAKCWPLSRYTQLADWLVARGYVPSFVLGPAERERGMEVQKFQLLQPGNLRELQEALHQADLVVGNDSGPMHLAGLMGLDGLALFGPAAAGQWGPLGLTCLQADISCSPCTQTGRIQCAHPVCMERLSWAEVKKAIESLSGEKK